MKLQRHGTRMILALTTTLPLFHMAASWNGDALAAPEPIASQTAAGGTLSNQTTDDSQHDGPFPEDWNDIKKLTPKQAKELAAREASRDVFAHVLELNGLETLSSDSARELVSGLEQSAHPETPIILSLNGLTNIEVETASLLASRRIVELKLNGLTQLDADTAQALGQGNGHLALNGLTTISKETLRGLGSGSVFSHLELNGLTTLDADVALALSQNLAAGAEVSLDGLTELDAETARILTLNTKGGMLQLSLDGLTKLDAKTARALAHENVWNLSLLGVTKLSDETLQVLAQWKGVTLALGLTEISAEAAAVLGSFQGIPMAGASLRLDVTKLDVAAARGLAKFQGLLWLMELQHIDAKLALELVKFKSTISIGPPSTVSDEAAKILEAKPDILMRTGG